MRWTTASRGRVARPAGEPVGEGQGVPTSTMGRRLAMAAATAFLTINIWTGCPLLALWIGAQIVGQRRVTMGSIFLIVIVLAVLVFSCAVALARLNAAYDALIGRPRIEPRATWLRSMRAEPEGRVAQRVGVTALERIVMFNVYLAVIALVVWYVFFAGPPLLASISLVA